MIIYLWTKILQYTWKIWQIILSPEDVCFQFQYPQIIFQPICQFEFMIKKIGVQFFSQLNHPRENFSLDSHLTFVCKRNFVWVLPMSSHKALNILDCIGRVFWLLVLPRSKLFSMTPKSFLTCIFVKNTVTAATIAV